MSAPGSGASAQRCRYFNTPNGCYHGDQCIFAHVKDEIPHAAHPAELPKRDLGNRHAKAEVITLSPAQVKTIQELSSDGLSPVRHEPAAVGAKIYAFLQRDVVFKDPKVKQSFARLLAAAGSADERWTYKERSDFLARISDPEKRGPLSIQEVLRTPLVTQFNFTPSPLFQNSLVLIVLFLTSTTVTRTTVSNATNVLYGIVDSNLSTILSRARDGIAQLLHSNGLRLRSTDTSSML